MVLGILNMHNCTKRRQREVRNCGRFCRGWNQQRERCDCMGGFVGDGIIKGKGVIVWEVLSGMESAKGGS